MFNKFVNIIPVAFIKKNPVLFYTIMFFLILITIYQITKAPNESKVGLVKIVEEIIENEEDEKKIECLKKLANGEDTLLKRLWGIYSFHLIPKNIKYDSKQDRLKNLSVFLSCPKFNIIFKEKNIFFLNQKQAWERLNLPTIRMVNQILLRDEEKLLFEGMDENYKNVLISLEYGGEYNIKYKPTAISDLKYSIIGYNYFLGKVFTLDYDKNVAIYFASDAPNDEILEQEPFIIPRDKSSEYTVIDGDLYKLRKDTEEPQLYLLEFDTSFFWKNLNLSLKNTNTDIQPNMLEISSSRNDFIIYNRTLSPENNNKFYFYFIENIANHYDSDSKKPTIVYKDTLGITNISSVIIYNSSDTIAFGMQGSTLSQKSSWRFLSENVSDCIIKLSQNSSQCRAFSGNAEKTKEYGEYIGLNVSADSYNFIYEKDDRYYVHSISKDSLAFKSEYFYDGYSYINLPAYSDKIQLLGTIGNNIAHVVIMPNNNRIELIGDINWPERPFDVELSYDSILIAILITFIMVIYFFGVTIVRDIAHPKEEFTSKVFNKIPTLKDKMNGILSTLETLKIRSDTMLFLGIIIGVFGVAIFIIVLGNISEKFDIKTDVNFRYILEASKPFILLLFIETISIFFLKQYRVIFNEYKIFYSVYLRLYNYFHAIELTELQNNTDNNSIFNKLIEQLIQDNHRLPIYGGNDKVDFIYKDMLNKLIDKIPNK